VSETYLGTRFGQYAGLQVRSPLTAEVIAQFQPEHNLLDWWPRSEDAALTQLMALADRLQALQVHAPNTHDDSPLAQLAELEFIEGRTGATNALDLSRLSALQSLEINDRPGPTGLDSLPLRTVRLTDTRRAPHEMEALPGLRELTLVAARHVAIDLRAHLPQLELLVVMRRGWGHCRICMRRRCNT